MMRLVLVRKLANKGVVMSNGRPLKTIILCGGILAITACSNNYVPISSSENANILSSTSVAQVKVSMKIYDSSNAVVYDDSNSASSLVLKANENYNLSLTPSQSLSGLSYNMALTKTSVVNAAAQNISLQAGANSFSVPSQGDYTMKLAVSAPSMLTLTKNYTASVTCSSPTFTANSLDASKISVSAGAVNNLFNISASGITANANGLAPYTCAFDPTGSGIIDTGFVDCASSIANFYNNYVATRNVAVMVKDSCGTVYTV